MTFHAIDGCFVGQRLAYVPRGYHCVMTLDNHPDIIACHPDFMREQFICAMLDGLEEFVDKQSSLVAINLMRHGQLNTMVMHVLNLLTDANEAIWSAQLEARSNDKSKG